MTALEALLLGLLAILPWGEGGVAPTPLAIVHSAIFAAAALVLFRSLRTGAIEMRLTWPLLAWTLFLAAGLVSFLRTDYLYGSFDTYWDQWAGFLLAAALACAAPSARFGARATALVVGLGVAQALPAIVTRLAAGAAVSPSFLNPNHTAAYLNVAALAALTRAPADGAGWGSRAWRAAGLLCVAGTLAIASRGALVALVVTLAIAFTLSRGAAGPSRFPWRAALPILAVLAVAAALSVQMRFASQIDPYRYDRPRLWAAALAAWRDAPALGLGPGMYEHRAPRYNFPQEGAAFRYAKEPHSAHSLLLQVLAEEGVVGVAALAFFAIVAAGALLREARPGPRRRPATGSATAPPFDEDARERGRCARAALLAAGAVAIHSLFENLFEAPAIPVTLVVLAWPALAPRGIAEAAAAFLWRWPSGDAGRRARAAVAASAASAGLALYALAVAGPYLSWLCARYAAAPGTPPVRIDLAVRAAESLNPFQPFLGYQRASAAVARAPAMTPPLLANALESLEKTARLAPGDPSAYALMGHVYGRAAADLDGAGPGALDAAERRFSEAIARAPRDARRFVDRAAFRLWRGEPHRALDDVEEALKLEPNALAAHALGVEALLSAGLTAEAASALRAEEAASARLRGHTPLNDYETVLMRVDRKELEKARSLLSSLLAFVPAGGLLGSGSAEGGCRRSLGEDLLEKRLLGLRPAPTLAVPVGVGAHAGLAHHGLYLVCGDGLHRVVEQELAPRAVVVDQVAETRTPLGHHEPPERSPIYRVCPAANRPRPVPLRRSRRPGESPEGGGIVAGRRGRTHLPRVDPEEREATAA